MGANWADIASQGWNVEVSPWCGKHRALGGPDSGLFLGCYSEFQAKPEGGSGMKFADTAKSSAALAVQLRDAARSKNPSATEAIMKDFGPKACGSCHTPFRQPAR
jgi:hypothetical protein